MVNFGFSKALDKKTRPMICTFGVFNLILRPYVRTIE
jgi:hypothetical protein